MLTYFFDAFMQLMTAQNILIMVLGVGIGIVFGALPGLTATMAVALCLPFSFGMGPISGFALLVALYIGGISGGLISAILINIPGTPSSIATTFDGAPMAKNGEAGRALGTGIVFSFLGTIFSIAVLVFVAPPLAEIALKFGPYEYFSLAFFALTFISALAGKSLIKGFVSGFIGMALASVGVSPIHGFPRFTFGINQLTNGFDLLPALVGLYAVSEILKSAESKEEPSQADVAPVKIKGFGFSMREFLGQTKNFFIASVIGTAIGILPGIGGGTSNILAYVAIKKASKHPEKFGTGIMDGIVASETANNASIGGAMVPLLSLGIPGDAVTAMLIGGFMIHGLSPGPLLFTDHPDVVYSIFAALIICSFLMLFMEFYGMRIFIKLLRIPKYILLPIVLTLCVVGAFGVNSRVFDAWGLLMFGLIGYLLEKFEFPLPPIILGFILGPMVETNFLRGMQYSGGDFTMFLKEPISCGFIAVAMLYLLWSLVNNIVKWSREGKSAKA